MEVALMEVIMYMFPSYRMKGSLKSVCLSNMLVGPSYRWVMTKTKSLHYEFQMEPDSVLSSGFVRASGLLNQYILEALPDGHNDVGF